MNENIVLGTPPYQIGTNLWKKHQENINIHHIFPVAWCTKTNPPVPPRLYNSIINKTPIDAATNRKIGGSGPSTYLRRLENDIDQDDLHSVLCSHWISPDLLAADRFADCFVERGEAMLELIGRAMGKPTPTGREIFRRALGSAGMAQEVDEYDETSDEHDVVGDWAYQESAVAAD